ncbi:NAD-binding protein [Natronorarus salvus]|uniref:NAD-binding protein n=1 Tax=Natronorarus salvus TaxID=3117733 RepID=UPI002F2693CE
MTNDTSERSDTALERVFYHTERVPFVYWEEVTGAKATVASVGVLAVLSFVTGLSNLSEPSLTLAGPLADVADAESYVRFANVLFAFVLVPVLAGLGRRKRVAWWVAVALVPLQALVPLSTGQTTEIPLLVVLAVTVVLLLINRGAFDRRVELSSLQIASLSSIVGVVAYGTVGSYALREQFEGLETWTDAVYYVIVSIATVGYGDIAPLSAEARWFSLSIILLGTGAFTAAIGALVIPAIESRMAAAVGQMTPSELTLLEDHVLVLGYSEITEPLLEELGEETDIVVVTPDADVASALDGRGVNVLTADPTTEEALEDARIDDARGVVVATLDDAQDVLAVLAARTASPEVRIVAAAVGTSHVDKLERVGADDVISLMGVGGRVIGRSVLSGTPAASVFDADDDP